MYKNKICQRCGIVMKGVGTRRKWCADCRVLVANERKQQQRRKKALDGGLDEVARRAAQAGMSYGRYVAKMEGREK